MQTEWQPGYLFRPKAKCSPPSHQGHVQVHLPARPKNPGWSRYGLTAGERRREGQQVKTREMPTFISPCCRLLSFLQVQACWSSGMHGSQVLFWQNLCNSGSSLSFKFASYVPATSDHICFCLNGFAKTDLMTFWGLFAVKSHPLRHSSTPLVGIWHPPLWHTQSSPCLSPPFLVNVLIFHQMLIQVLKNL